MNNHDCQEIYVENHNDTWFYASTKCLQGIVAIFKNGIEIKTVSMDLTNKQYTVYWNYSKVANQFMLLTVKFYHDTSLKNTTTYKIVGTEKEIQKLVDILTKNNLKEEDK